MRCAPRALLLGACLALAGTALPALGPPAAHAAECRVIDGGDPSLEHIDARLRLAFIQGRLRHGARKARIWSWGWGGTYATLTAFQLVVLGATALPPQPGTPAATDEDRINLAVGAGTSLVGMLALVVFPLKIMRDQRWLDRRIADAGPGTDPCALLSDAERLLLRDADNEGGGKAWYVHVANLAINTGVGIALAVAFKDGWTGLIGGLSGAALGELMVLTQPGDAIGDLRRYRRAQLDLPVAATERPPVTWRVAPTFGPRTLGVGLRVTY